jgi:FAD dependent oxidoreductase.
MRIAVVGLGAVGSAALRFLAQQGHEAVGYEQFTRGHTRGSSHGESRIYRLTYADPHYTRLMREASPLLAGVASGGRRGTHRALRGAVAWRR